MRGRGYTFFFFRTARQADAKCQPQISGTKGKDRIVFLVSVGRSGSSAHSHLLGGCATDILRWVQEDLVSHPPDHFVAVPLVFEVLYNGVQRKLATAPPSRQKVAKLLISASQKYMDAVREWRVSPAAPHRHLFSRMDVWPPCWTAVSLRFWFTAVVCICKMLSFAGERPSFLPPLSQGLALQSVRTSSPPVTSFARWLLAGLVAALLFPVHLLASRLVFSKVRDALGIRKVSRDDSTRSAAKWWTAR
jgi:long-subunit acyl-CoA synthetase (AMP-forming)